MSRCLYPGCGAEAKPKGQYCKDAHRAAAHKLRARLGGLLPRERKRVRDAAVKRAARAGGVIPSDVRISYAKAVDVVAEALCQVSAGSWNVTGNGRGDAEVILQDALPGRLRRALEDEVERILEDRA